MCMEMSCACFRLKAFYLCRAFEIAAVSTTFNVFSYDAVGAENPAKTLGQGDVITE